MAVHDKSPRVLCFLPSTVLYGKERSNIEVFKILKDNNFNALVLFNKNSNIELKEELNSFQTSPILYPQRNHKYFKYIRYIIELILSNIKVFFLYLKFRPDYIYVNSETTIYDFFFIFYATTKKIIYRIGDAPAYPILAFSRLNQFMWENITVKKMHSIVSISQYINNLVRETGRQSINDKIIYNFPPHRKNQQLNDIVINRDDQELVIGYIGQIIPVKGVDLLTDAVLTLIKKGYSLKLVIAGSLDYNKEFSEKLLSNIKVSGNSKSVIFLGQINDIKSFFSSIDVLCVPSIYEEPLGNVVVEGKAHSKPIIIFPSGGMPELIHHKVNGYICSAKSTDALINAILYYANDKSLIQKEGLESKKSLDSLGIRYDEFCQKWLEVFNS